ncbi:unnamed protein product [Amoebophrya sp. A120]|nr:unnamed protein product [Amoebophrya sp. A120]|eukprot:GSA120T00017998001.1
MRGKHTGFVQPCECAAHKKLFSSTPSYSSSSVVASAVEKKMEDLVSLSESCSFAAEHTVKFLFEADVVDDHHAPTYGSALHLSSSSPGAEPALPTGSSSSSCTTTTRSWHTTTSAGPDEVAVVAPPAPDSRPSKMQADFSKSLREQIPCAMLVHVSTTRTIQHGTNKNVMDSNCISSAPPASKETEIKYGDLPADELPAFFVTDVRWHKTKIEARRAAERTVYALRGPNTNPVTRVAADYVEPLVHPPEFHIDNRSVLQPPPGEQEHLHHVVDPALDSSTITEKPSSTSFTCLAGGGGAGRRLGLMCDGGSRTSGRGPLGPGDENTTARTTRTAQEAQPRALSMSVNKPSAAISSSASDDSTAARLDTGSRRSPTVDNALPQGPPRERGLCEVEENDEQDHCSTGTRTSPSSSAAKRSLCTSTTTTGDATSTARTRTQSAASATSSTSSVTVNEEVEVGRQEDVDPGPQHHDEAATLISPEDLKISHDNHCRTATDG